MRMQSTADLDDLISIKKCECNIQARNQANMLKKQICKKKLTKCSQGFRGVMPETITLPLE